MLPLLIENHPEQPFPPLSTALADPNGLLAVGGCLSPQRLINAYQHGVFPWYNPDEPILWWSPDPRLVVFPEQIHISRSLRKTLRKKLFTTTFDQAFVAVISACAEARNYETGTWISKEMQQAYIRLHHLGYAHSVEVWYEGKLVGGLYGIAIGQIFFGESMFHFKTDASKVAFVSLIEQLKQWDFKLVDCQVHSDHLASLGGQEIARAEFEMYLKKYCPVQQNYNWSIS